MRRRRQALLIAAAIAAVSGQVFVFYVPGPSPPLIATITGSAVGLSFLAAGIAAWLRWPASRLGLLFTLVGYFWLLPAVGHLPYPLPSAISNVTAGLYGAALAHLGLAWPTGRLRSRFEVGVVIAEYTWSIGQSVAYLAFWNPLTAGCSCPANLMLIDGSSSMDNIIDVLSIPVGIALTGIVLVLIVRHWQTARGWTRRAMLPLLWIAPAICALQAVQTVAGNTNLAIFGSDTARNILYGYLPLILLGARPCSWPAPC